MTRQKPNRKPKGSRPPERPPQTFDEVADLIQSALRPW